MTTKNIVEPHQLETEDELSTTYLKKIIAMLGYRVISIINSSSEIVIKIKKNYN